MCPQVVERGSRSSHDSYKGTNPFSEDSTLLISSNPNLPPKGPTFSYNHIVGRVSITQMKPRGHLLEEFLLLGVGQPFVWAFSLLHPHEGSPSALHRTHQFKCKSHPQTYSWKYPESCLNRYWHCGPNTLIHKVNHCSWEEMMGKRQEERSSRVSRRGCFQKCCILKLGFLFFFSPKSLMLA